MALLRARACRSFLRNPRKKKPGGDPRKGLHPVTAQRACDQAFAPTVIGLRGPVQPRALSWRASSEQATLRIR